MLLIESLNHRCPCFPRSTMSPTTAPMTTALAVQNATNDHHVTTSRQESTEAPRENRRRQHLPAPLLSMNMKPDSEDGEEGMESEPQSPPRPNRSRSLVRQQHRTFYPYFLNRVLGR